MASNAIPYVQFEVGVHELPHARLVTMDFLLSTVYLFCTFPLSLEKKKLLGRLWHCCVALIRE